MSSSNELGVASRRRLTTWKGLAFASPFLVRLVLLIGFPLVASAYYSFTDFNLFQAPKFVGLQNYVEMGQDPLFWQSVWNTAFLVLAGVPLALVLSLAFAHVLNLPVKGQQLFRALVYLPTIVPVVVGGFLWRWLLNGEYGFVNYFLGLIGVPQPLWLVEPEWGKPAILLIFMWTIGGTTLIYLAALKEVPLELYEAAALDGAGPLTRFKHVTWPSISAVTLFQVVVLTIGFFQIFSEPYVLSKTAAAGTPGGAGNSMLTYGVYLFQNAFSYLKMGYASAMAWVLFLVTLAVTSIILLSSRRWVHHD